MKRIYKVSAIVLGLMAGAGGLAGAYAHGFGPGGGWHGPFAGRHMDGKIAFLKAELQITEAQEPQWRAVEEALRAGAERMQKTRKEFRATRDGKKEGVSALDRLTRMEAAATGAAESLREIRTAFEPLYASMSDEQKKRADSLLRRGGHHRRGR